MNKFILTLAFLLTVSTSPVSAMINPWTDCGEDLNCGAGVAGFSFPLKIENYTVRAMKGMFEVRFSLEDNRDVIIRKAETFEGKPDENGIIDISGDYNQYPVNKTITLNNGVKFSVRGEDENYRVANFAAETGYYSITCDKGLSTQDLEYFYNLLAEAETPYNNH